MDEFGTLLDVLRQQRDEGASFEDAWPAAVTAALKGVPGGAIAHNMVFAALNETVGAWRAAFERTPATPGEVALTRLSEVMLPVADAVTPGQRSQLMERMRDDGESYSTISASLGVNRSTVRSALTYEPRPPRPPATTCKHGHDMSGENAYVRADGARVCRTCQRTSTREAMRRRRAEATDSGAAPPVSRPTTRRSPACSPTRAAMSCRTASRARDGSGSAPDAQYVGAAFHLFAVEREVVADAATQGQPHGLGRPSA